MKLSLILLLMGFLVLPLMKAAPASPKGPSITFYDPLHNTGMLKKSLAAGAYDVTVFSDKIDKNALLITTIFDDQVSRHLQSGGRVIILCNSLNTFPEGAPFKVIERDQSD